MKIEYDILFGLGWFGSLKLMILLLFLINKKRQISVLNTVKFQTLDCLG